MHNKPSLGRLGVTDYTVLEPSNIRDLDQQASESINGDEGGSWNPAEPIAIGGSGVKISTDAAVSLSNFFGKVSTGPGSAGLILNDNDYPIPENTRSRSFVVPIGSIWLKSESQPTTTNNYPFDEGTPGQVRSIITSGSIAGTVLSGWIPSHRLPQSCVIDSVEFRFRIGTRPSSMPLALPLFRVFRMPKTAIFGSIAAHELWDYPPWQASFDYSSYIGTKYAIRRATGANGWIFRLVTGGGSYLSGGVQPAAFSGALTPGTNIVDNQVTWQAEQVVNGTSYFAMPRGNMVFAPTSPPFGTAMEEYYAYGRTQTITITPNQNNVVDTSLYNYGWDIIDTSNTGNIFTSLKVNISNISSFQAY